MEREYEWDTKKNVLNVKKHGVSFEEAARVFDDPFALCESDRVENGEQRFQTLGIVDGCVLLLVAHTVWIEDERVEIIRLISARRATRPERKKYEQSAR